MRVFVATAVLVGCVLMYLVSPSASAQGQSTQAAIAYGETLILYFEPNSVSKNCTVTEIRGDFVGCKADTDHIGRTNYEHWYNLRLIARIDRPVKAH